MNPVWHFLNGVPIIPVARIGTGLFGDGTAAAPGISFTSDADNGAYFISANTWGLSAAGALQFQIENGAVRVASAGLLGFGADVALSRGAANRLDLASGDSFNLVLGNITYGGANGQVFSDVQQLTELTTVAAAATTDTTIQMPAGAVVLAVSVRTTVTIPTATSYTVGDSGSAARFNTANVGVAANSTDAGTKAGAYYNAGALAVRLTMVGGTPANNAGRVRVTIYYYTVTPPTS